MVGGKLKTTANPLSKHRLENILGEIEEAECNIEDDAYKTVELNDDEVSILFYGNTCGCTIKSTCSTMRCQCFKSGQQCNDVCNCKRNLCKNK